MGSGTTRLGGLCGVASAGAIIPAYLAGSPESPKSSSDAQRYFEDAASFLTANGTLPLLSAAYSTMVWIGLTGFLMLVIPLVVRVESVGV